MPGIVDDAGEQAAGLLTVAGLRLCHQPFGEQAASGRVISAFHRTFECGAGFRCLGRGQCLRMQQGLFRFAASARVAGEQAVQRLSSERGMPGVEARAGQACQDVRIVAQWRAGCLLEQGSGFLCLAGIQQRHA